MRKKARHAFNYAEKNSLKLVSSQIYTIRAIRRKLFSNVGKNHQVVNLTLTVLETCAKNCRFDTGTINGSKSTVPTI